MFRRFTLSTIAALVFVLPVVARAGGLPMLCLPVDGATAAKADACAKAVGAALGKEVDHVQLKQNDGQWYLTFYFGRDGVRLADIEAALKTCSISVQHDKLRLFGDAILEIRAPEAASAKLLAALKATKHVSVEESKREGDTLLVTLKLPTFENDIRRVSDFGQISFEKEPFKSEGASQPNANLGELPTYEGLRKMFEQHDARLVGLRWDCWVCRPLGCLAVPAKERTAARTVRAN